MLRLLGKNTFTAESKRHCSWKIILSILSFSNGWLDGALMLFITRNERKNETKRAIKTHFEVIRLYKHVVFKEKIDKMSIYLFIFRNEQQRYRKRHLIRFVRAKKGGIPLLTLTSTDKAYFVFIFQKNRKVYRLFYRKKYFWLLSVFFFLEGIVKVFLYFVRFT